MAPPLTPTRTMNLPRAGREYARFVFEDFPTGATPEAQVADGSWTTMTADGDEWLLLVKGPDFVGDAQGELVSVTSNVAVRVVDAPETIIRRAGTIVII